MYKVRVSVMLAQVQCYNLTSCQALKDIHLTLATYRPNLKKMNRTHNYPILFNVPVMGLMTSSMNGWLGIPCPFQHYSIHNMLMEECLYKMLSAMQCCIGRARDQTLDAAMRSWLGNAITSRCTIKGPTTLSFCGWRLAATCVSFRLLSCFCRGCSHACKFMVYIVRPANRDWACQTERCHTLSNKTSLQ